MHNVGHVRNQTERLNLPVLEVGLQQAKNLRVCFVKARLVNLNDCALSTKLLHFFVHFLPCIKLFELRSLSQVKKKDVLLSVGLELLHEGAHRLDVDVVVAGDATHVRGENLLSLSVVANQACCIELLNCVLHLVQQDHVASRVHLKLLSLDLVASWVLEHSTVVE